ncbi:probable ATP-dependent RNA helicase spindle-E [Bacillus rossius redtenbacheri]|uniref:probable ATP-dependent RNA helicase spindle-E n=1 Tax=Bacillus rossius redtenbacheri TaxID=93214 RepID=UPI002FDDB790
MAAKRPGDAIADFFNLRPVETIYYDGGITRGHVQAVPEDKRDPYLVRLEKLKQLDRGQEYVDNIRKSEILKMAATMQIRDPEPSERSVPGPSGIDMEGIDTTVSLATNLPDLSDLDPGDTDVYNLYDFTHTVDSSLPIYKNREMIVRSVEGNQVTILQGPTGCGKSTQVPQYILDDCFQKQKPCNIIITQPRRIAAITVARRVAHERKWQLPSVVGFHVGLNNQTTQDTRMTFCTTGVLVQKIINNKNLLNYTHVILDEVHERDMDMDFAILLVRKLIYSTSRHVKVVLMSATFNVAKFKQYFEGSTADSECMLVPVPTIDVDMSSKAERFRIKDFYLCQLGILGELPTVKVEEPCVHKETCIIANNLIKEFDRLESLSQPKAKTRGAVLVFLPGIHEIENMYNILEENAKERKWVLQPLHSTITVEEQERVFRPVEKGFRKIILSTNIAESSITVPDIVYVIDFCLTKHMVCDMKTNFSSLQLAWASKANCTQRAGRSGRVCEGRVYRLVPQKFYERELLPECVPEIQRAPLAQVVLQSKVLDMGSPKEILALALDPPDLTNIEQTVLLLKETGALLLEHDGELDPEDGQITFIGRVMARLPLDIKVSRMIILGFLYSVLDECIIMGAAMSLKSMFSSPFQERLKAYNSKLTWADGSCSDLISFLNAYQVWQNNIRQGYFERSVGGGEASWARRYFIQLNTMKDVHHLVNELTQRLGAVGIRTSVGEHRVKWTPAEKPFVMKVVISGAFYPNYFVRGASGGQINEQDAVKQIGGYDPFTTVYCNRFPTNQPGELYAQAIKNKLRDCASDMRVYFDGSSKVYIQFPKSHLIERDDRKLEANIPGRVSLAVYRAVKMRMLNLPIQIPMLPPDEARRRAEALGLRRNQSLFSTPSASSSENQDRRFQPLKSALPGIADSFIGIKISHFIDPGHFWAHNQSNEVEAILRIINMNQKELVPLKEKPKPGQLLAAPFTDSGITFYYRARVNALLRSRDQMRVEVFFVDYGNTEIVMESELLDFGPSLLPEDDYNILDHRAQAFECVLCEIQPSLKCSDKGHWTAEAIDAFKTQVLARTDCEVYGKIFSVVDGVVSLELSLSDPSKPNCMLNVNEWLIKKNYADRAEESFLSKINHDARMQLMASNMDAGASSYPQEQNPNWTAPSQTDLESPSSRECKQLVRLGGPNSPLEMHIHGQTYVARERDQTIEGLSVNSVLLDTDPQDPHDRLLVAAVVEEKSSGSSLILRHTTMMPNIHGFGALMAILFAPTIELRVNEARTKFTGALCGLGCDNITKHPLFLEHDMDVTFDVEIDIEDLQNVNRLRYWMNMGLTPQQGTDILVEESAYMNSVHHKLKEWLMKLMMKRRKSQELCMARKSFMWGELSEDWLMDPCSGEEDESSIFKLHWGVNLLEEDETHFSEMRAHVSALRLLANGTGPVKDATCKLCQVTVSSAQLLRLHLESAQHRDHEAMLSKALAHGQPG